MLRLLVLLIVGGLWAGGAAAQTGAIVGTITDAEEGGPLVGANVAVEGTTQGTTADVDGRYALRGLEPGSYTLVVTFVGFGEVRRSVGVAAGETSTADFALQPSTLVGNEVVITGTRQPEKVLDAPVTVEAISAENLETSGGGTFLSALANLKGIDFVDVGINGQGISARGFATQFNTRMLAMTDGRVAQLPGTGLPQGNFLPTTPLDVKAVEVVVGPASALYGPNAHTGVINVITKDPWDEAGLAVAARGGQQSLMDVTARAAGTIGEQFGWKVTGQYLTADDFEPDAEAGTHNYNSPHFEGDLLEDYGIESRKAEGFLYYRFADGWQARVGGGWSENDNFGLTNNGRNHIRDWQVNFQTAQISSEHWYAQFTRTGNDAGKTYQINQVAAGTAAMDEVDAGTLEPMRDALKFVDRGELYDSEIQYHNALAGVELTTGVQYRQYRPDSDGTFLADANGEDIDATELGGYLQLDARLLGDRLRLVGAARVDQHSNYDTQFSPKAAAVYTVAPAHNVRVGYNRAFKSPTILENNLFILSDLTASVPGYYLSLLGNTNGYTLRAPDGTETRVDPLEPEQVSALELGYKGIFAKRLFVDVVGYYSWYQNFISPLTLVSDGFTTVPFHDDGTPVEVDGSAFNGLMTYLNFGEAEVAGLDVGVNVYANDYLNLSGSVSLIDLRSFTKDSDEQDDLRLNVPETKLKGMVTVRDYGMQGYFVSLGARWQSAYEFVSGYWNSNVLLDDDGDVTDTEELPARLVADLTLGYNLPEYGVGLKASVSNLFDNQDVDVLGSPVRGRFIWVGLTYRFDGLRF